MSLLSYTPCEWDVGELKECQEEWDVLLASISGRSDEYYTITEPASNHFDGLIGQGLKEVAGNNREAWENAMLACIHSFGILGKAIEDVEWYEGKIEDIKIRLSAALNDESNYEDATTAKEIAAETSNITNLYNTEAGLAWEEFERKMPGNSK
ncbi:hypothetical protein [Nocardiopsis metallicus]|uniref:Uncharacterized protein n=1 Tax=Nocardiopsis metallicus TaxID=179819 RepID=A0A840WBS1_9ACTN|nr:hypothetical protein [Nocardiopsis metallicus]MBB5493594.1 hypothetical protein [Nocardiopsis metallicus]